MKKLRDKLKDPGIQMQIAFAVMLIGLWIVSTRAWEGLEWGL